MVVVKEIFPVARPEPPAASGQREVGFVSRDGVWRLVLYDPVEFHIGADGWRVRLEEHGVDVTDQHDLLGDLRRRRLGRYVPAYQPWNACGGLALAQWVFGGGGTARSLCFYYPGKRQTVRCQLPLPPRRFEGSPVDDRFLVVTTADARLLAGADGRVLKSVRHSTDDYTRPPEYAWVDCDNVILSMSRGGKGARAQLRLYDGSTLERLGCQDIDARNHVPIDPNCAEVVDGNTMRLTYRGAEDWGCYHDGWYSVRYEPGTRLLYLSTLRPSGTSFHHTPPHGAPPRRNSADDWLEPSRWILIAARGLMSLLTKVTRHSVPPPRPYQAQTVCEAREHWVAVRLACEPDRVAAP